MRLPESGHESKSAEAFLTSYISHFSYRALFVFLKNPAEMPDHLAQESRHKDALCLPLSRCNRITKSIKSAISRLHRAPREHKSHDAAASLPFALRRGALARETRRDGCDVRALCVSNTRGAYRSITAGAESALQNSRRAHLESGSQRSLIGRGCPAGRSEIARERIQWTRARVPRPDISVAAVPRIKRRGAALPTRSSPAPRIDNNPEKMIDINTTRR